MAAYTADQLQQFVDYDDIADVTFKSTGESILAKLVEFEETDEPYQYILTMYYRSEDGLRVGFIAPFDATNDTICVPECVD